MPRCYKPTAELAMICGVDTPAVLKAAQSLELKSKKGAKGAKLWPCPEIPRAIFAQPERKGLDYERERLTKAQADKTELEAEVLRGNLVPREVVEDTVGRMVTAARARLLSIPTKSAAVAVTMSESEIEHLLTGQIHEALSELAAERVGAVEAAPEADSQPVGRRKPKAEPRGKRRAGAVEH